MRRFRFLKGKMVGSEGFTLIEVLAVIVLLGILGGIAVPSVTSAIEKAKEDVCHVNAQKVERMYEAHLVFESVDHSDEVFDQFLQEVDRNLCPLDGEVNYVGGTVQCNVHSVEIEDEQESEDAATEGVPYL